MKPFNLEEAKAGNPLITRDGDSVTFIAHVPDAMEWSQLLVLKDRTVRHRYADGSVVPDIENLGDLFMAPVKRVVWVVAAKRPFATGHRFAWTYENENDALEQINRCNFYTGPYRLEIEE